MLREDHAYSMWPIAKCMLVAILGLSFVPAVAQKATEPAVMAAVHAKYAKLSSLRAKFEIIGDDGKTVSRGTFKLMKPNFQYFQYTEGGDSAYISDGKTVFIVQPSLGSASKSPSDPHGVGLPPYDFTMMLFFDPTALRTRLFRGSPLSYMGTEKYRNVTYQVVKIGPNKIRPNLTKTIYIGPDHLVHRQVSVLVLKSGLPSRTEVLLTDIDTTPGLTKKDFVYSPPANFRVYNFFPDGK